MRSPVTFGRAGIAPRQPGVWRSRNQMAAGGRWGYRRTSQTASSRKPREVGESFLTVTHPFHPLCGERLRVLFERRYQVTGLAFCCEGGPLGSVMLPITWTDRAEPPGAQALGFEQLVELAALVGALVTRRGQ